MQRKEFVKICQNLSIPISEALVSLCLNGRREFTQWTGIHLLNVMNELLDLQRHHDVALSWAASENVATAIVQRRKNAVDEAKV
jgi:hypothetical protein